jgi:hypothetical protein
MSVWDERAEAYRTSEAHREGHDLDLLVDWAAGARTALDVATGGGHVARRLHPGRRVAAHHFENIEAAVREMARVARDLVLVSDNLFVGDAAEEADRVRDPSHARNYTEEEWRRLFAGAGLRVEEALVYEHPVLFEPWLERAGCTGKDAERVRALVADRLDGDRLRLERICLKGRKTRDG